MLSSNDLFSNGSFWQKLLPALLGLLGNRPREFRCEFLPLLLKGLSSEEDSSAPTYAVFKLHDISKLSHQC